MFIRVKSPLGNILCEIDSSMCHTIGEILQKVTETTHAQNVYLKPDFWKYRDIGLHPDIPKPCDINEYVLACITSNTIFTYSLCNEECIDDKQTVEMFKMVLQATITFILSGIIFGFIFN